MGGAKIYFFLPESQFRKQKLLIQGLMYRGVYIKGLLRAVEFYSGYVKVLPNYDTTLTKIMTDTISYFVSVRFFPIHLVLYHMSDTI